MNKNVLLNSAGKIGAKPFIILVLILLFLIPLNMPRTLIYDRQQYQESAVDSILEPKGGSPVVEGFAIAVPFTEAVEVRQESATHIETRRAYIICVPETWNVRFFAKPEFLTRGIFQVPVFSGTVNSDGEFSAVDVSYGNIANDDILWDECLLMLGVSNKKNLTSLPSVMVSANLPNVANNSSANGEPLEMSLVSPDVVSPFTNTVFYRLPSRYAAQGFSFSVSADIQGGESFGIMPLATNNNFFIESTWTTPSFKGGWLPTKREISDEGFSAEWNIAGLSTIFSKEWVVRNASSGGNGGSFRENYSSYNGDYNAYNRNGAEIVQVEFVTPVDNYQKTERSIKYALLFLLVPFLAIFIFEIFTRRKIHPVQYCLIGLADVIFYLLLLSISEHISFSLTYWISSFAVSFLMLFYATAIFKKFKWGSLFALVQMTAYIFLFGTLQAEDYALLIGSLGLFFVVVMLMVLTRKVDWYAGGE